LKTVTIFSWGYWGWGSATAQFVAAADAIERKRGFRPPLFVDTRIRRSGRAIGFIGGAFQELVGEDRHVHMPKLGNRRILTRKGPKIQIAQPESVNELLDLALDAAKKKRRLIFFSSSSVGARCRSLREKFVAIAQSSRNCSWRRPSAGKSGSKWWNGREGSRVISGWKLSRRSSKLWRKARCTSHCMAARNPPISRVRPGEALPPLHATEKPFTGWWARSSGGTAAGSFRCSSGRMPFPLGKSEGEFLRVFRALA
jgi:hypothetical protein